MSDDSFTVVGLDRLGSDEVEAVASAVETWLVGEGVITGDTGADERRSGRWLRGPRWRMVVDPFTVMDELLDESVGNGVDVVRKREVHVPIENAEPPACPRCSTVLDDDTYYAPIEDWLAGPEPSLTCEQCGTTALIGDWPNRWGYAIGAPAVVFHNWPRLQDSFVSTLRSRLGVRTYLVRSHF